MGWAERANPNSRQNRRRTGAAYVEIKQTGGYAPVRALAPSRFQRLVNGLLRGLGLKRRAA